MSTQSNSSISGISKLVKKNTQDHRTTECLKPIDCLNCLWLDYCSLNPQIAEKGEDFLAEVYGVY